MFCSKCGKEIDDEAIVCPGCGCATNNYKEVGKKASTNTPKKALFIMGTIILIVCFLGIVSGASKTSKYKPLYNSAHENYMHYQYKLDANKAVMGDTVGYERFVASGEYSDYLKAKTENDYYHKKLKSGESMTLFSVFCAPVGLIMILAYLAKNKKRKA